MTLRVDLGVVDEIIEAVLDRGSISKQDVIDLWGLDDEAYEDLRDLVPRRAGHGLAVGPRRIGGFVVAQRGRLPDDATAEAVTFRSDWERRAADGLAVLLDHSVLEALLGNLVQTIRQARKHVTGLDRRGTKAELAAALVIQHGQDLFRDKSIREAVARKLHIECPGRWHPGKTAAIRFVEAAGFPPELAGAPTPDSLPSFELLEGRVELAELWAFQREIQRELLNCLYVPGARGLVTLPTGAGKTRVAVETIRYWLPDRYDANNGQARQAAVLWLAHTEELCEQAYQCFKQVWESHEFKTPLFLVRFWGKYTSTLDETREAVRQARLVPTILISTPHRLINLLRHRDRDQEGVLDELQHITGLLVIDEAHRAAASSYREIVATFEQGSAPVSVVGMTATPFRMEYVPDSPSQGTLELRDIFGKLLEARETLGEGARTKLQEMGVLACPVFEEIRTPTSVRDLGVSDQEILTDGDIERVDRVLALRTDNSPRRLLLLERLVTAAAEPGSSILYFGPSVRDAECMAYLLRSRRIPCAVVTGNTRDVVRRDVIEAFKKGRIKVLCNCEVLTTGFDAPKVTHIMVARPTVSQVLYEQMVGRGLRGEKFGGTDSCVIIDCIDTIRGTRPTLGYEAFRKVWM